MRQLGNEKLTANEVTFILIGIMVDVSVAGLPNAVTKLAKQDGWISAGLGAIYPLYVALIAIYVSSKHPKENILVLSKRYLGNVLGNVLNVIFLLSFFSYYPSLISLTTIVMKLYVVDFLKPNIIYMFLAIVAVFTANKGIKVLAKICSVTFYLIITIIIISCFVIKDGSFLNICPMLGSGVSNILKASLASAYDYALLEIVFFIYPFIDESSKVKKATLKAVLYTFLLYVGVTLLTIYYMGVDIISKTSWAFFSVTEAIKLEVINNFRFVFIFFWIIIAVKSTALIQYFCQLCIDEFRGKKSNLYIGSIVSVVAIIIAMKYYPDKLTRSFIIGFTSKYSILFNLMYITLIAILIFIKRDEYSEKK